jgi:hypothetical protein
MTKNMETSPAKSALEELEFLRKCFRESAKQYIAAVETDILTVKRAIEDLEKSKARSAPDRIRDLRDMLTLMRRLDIKPEKGRRKDLKKVDLLLRDLIDLTVNW